MDFLPSSAEKEEVRLVLTDANIQIDRIADYEFLSHFENPCDGWSFGFGASSVDSTLRAALVAGAAVQLFINNAPQSAGFIDSVDIAVSKRSGTQLRVGGRDCMSPALKASADPTQSFKEGTTLDQALVTLFKPYGWSGTDQFLIDASADRDLRTNDIRDVKRSKKGKPLKSFVLHQLRPNAHEGVYEFAHRLSTHFGLWIWPSADGQRLIVSTPDFDQAPTYQIRHNATGTSNVLDGAVKFDASNQPSMIVANGFAQTADRGRNQATVFARNPSITVRGDAFDPKSRWPGITEVVLPAQSTTLAVQHECVVHLHDDEGQTLEQLQFYLRREMAHLQRHAVTAHYTTEGHGQMIGGVLVPWAIDTVVDVQDDLCGLHDKMYIVARTFLKSREGGTKTRLELISLNTLVSG